MTDFRYIKYYKIESDQLRQLKYTQGQIDTMKADGILPESIEVNDDPYPDLEVIDCVHSDWR
jgi:hypothetical protein